MLLCFIFCRRRGPRCYTQPGHGPRYQQHRARSLRPQRGTRPENSPLASWRPSRSACGNRHTSFPPAQPQLQAVHGAIPQHVSSGRQPPVTLRVQTFFGNVLKRTKQQFVTRPSENRNTQPRPTLREYRSEGGRPASRGGPPAGPERRPAATHQLPSAVPQQAAHRAAAGGQRPQPRPRAQRLPHQQRHLGSPPPTAAPRARDVSGARSGDARGRRESRLARRDKAGGRWLRGAAVALCCWSLWNGLLVTVDCLYLIGAIKGFLGAWIPYLNC